MASVKVAVRVRPFNNRERDMKAQLIIEMEGKKTRISNSKVSTAKMDGEAMREKYKDFTFDYSYWSYDTNDDHFASQEQVFKDLGRDVVDNAFEGYNACVFAYGQTGSGKTHTMMGAPTPEAQGLIPRICQDMFNRMNAGKEKGTTYRTEVSYLEIYNERVKDLLKRDQTHSLRVREHPKQGPYVEGLSKHLVMDYDDIQGLMNRGNANRTTASTNMNDVSSRSHAIFTMTFVQASFVGDMPSETVSKIHLVDLAGSERADATGATGQRLKEGAHINKSLVTLGSVISALAEASQTQSQKKVFIPYRDSVLTWLLKDSLGGNAKTIMIATISPADCNFGETLSTLRYANRAKNIVNKPTINEDPNVKLIRDLRSEIAKLRSLLKNDLPSDDVLEELHKKEAKEKSLTEEWTEKWKETQTILMEQKDLALRKAGPGVVLDSQMPHLIGIDDDLLSTGITLYHLKEGETKIGSEEAGDQHDITLKGQGVEAQHCSISLEGGVATLVPNNGSVCLVNGQQVDKPTRLFQGCVILLGRTNMFRYNDPAEAEKLRREGSHSHMNLSRLSFLSRSASDLAWSDSPLNASTTSATGEESSVLEEKRKLIEAEEARLKKESEDLVNQKKQLEEQKIIYEQLQAEKEEAWKLEQLSKSAAIHSAQKELEDRRLKLEQEYAAHRRRLAEDWKRLEQQEQETLASLQSKEKDLKKRRELLEWEVDQEMNQIETEAQKIETLRASLESKKEQVETLGQRLSSDLTNKLEKSESEIKDLLEMDETKFQEYVDEQNRKISQWKTNNYNALLQQKGSIHDKLTELAEKIASTTDDQQKEVLEEHQRELQNQASKIIEEITSLDNSYQKTKADLNEKTKALMESRNTYSDKVNEVKQLEGDIEKGISKMEASEDKITRLEADLVLIADQEKLIVSQLAHIDNSKQKLLTIIENSEEGDAAVDPKDQNLPLNISENEGNASGDQDAYVTALSTTSDNSNQWNTKDLNGISLTSTPIHQKGSSDSSRDSSPSRLNRKNDLNILKSEDMSPISKASSYAQKLISPGLGRLGDTLTPTETILELKRLVDQINEQKGIVLECLENDCDKEELNGHMVILQELRNRYLEIEALLDTSSRRWLSFDDDSSTVDVDKGDDSTAANDSEFDDSEIQSSVTDHEEHIQMLVEQRVEMRLREIFEDMKKGTKPYLLLREQYMRNHGRSMPSGLNNASGSDEDSSPTPNPGIPRSTSLSSGLWPGLNQGEGVIPGILDISIPNYFLRGSGASAHFQYEVCIVTSLERWTVLRRYSRFRDLHNVMSRKYGGKVSSIPFPPKKFFGRRSESIAKERQKLLEGYLWALIQVCATIPNCPLHGCSPAKVKDTLVTFSNFFQNGVSESTNCGPT